jgi:hypothetical protein
MRSPVAMSKGARRSWLHIRQSLYLLRPCRRLPNRIREVSCVPGMKMSQPWRSYLASCGTSVCGLPWNGSERDWGPFRSYCAVFTSCQYTACLPALPLKYQNGHENLQSWSVCPFGLRPVRFNSSLPSSRKMRPIVVRLSGCRTLGISRGLFHVLQESKRLRISYCRPNIGTRNEARSPPSSTHHP